jgi:CDP-glycerol glycerophosphotransferase (TagB/SpsB family)
MIKILFYAVKSLHVPHMEPISWWFKNYREDVEIRYSSPDGALREMDLKELSEKEYKSISVDQAKAWKPDITVLADVNFKDVVWGGKKVNVNHALISKGFYFTKTRYTKRDDDADLVCVPGDYHADILKSTLKTKVVATGYVKFDEFGSGRITSDDIRKSYNIPLDAEVITFVPTHNIELSAVPIVTHEIRKLIENGRYLFIKLHGASSKKWFDLYRLLAKLEERIIFIEGSDATPAIIAADVVISDVSSTYLEAMALEKPVVLLDSPYQKKFYNYDERDIEYVYRDVAIRVETMDELIDAVDRSLKNPDEKKEIREKYKPGLIGPIDGNAAKRTAEAILNLLD